RRSASRSPGRRRRKGMAGLTLEVLGRPARLLLVEDNRGDALLTREAFAAAGVDNPLELAPDGETALRRLAGEPRGLPDVVLLDLNLPGVDGVEVLGAIRAAPALEGVVVLALAGSETTDLLGRRGVWPDGNLEKPVTLDRLMQVLATVGPFRLTRTGE